MWVKTASSQSMFASLFAGTSHYQGDLSEAIYEPKHTHFAGGVGLLYEMNPHMLLRGDFTFGRISGSDADGVRNRSRNLSFTSTINEFSIGFEYSILDLYYFKVSPYLFAGAALYRFSPYTKDSNGNLFSLWELNTEGQGFYEDRKQYKLTQLGFPFGGGFQWAMSDNLRLGVVVGLRQTFTDYLDDVSKTYVDQDLLRAKKGNNAVNYAYRGDELPDGSPYPVDGTPRGNPTNRDMYYFTGLTLRVRVQNKTQRKAKKYKVEKSRITCPRPVY